MFDWEWRGCGYRLADGQVGRGCMGEQTEGQMDERMGVQKDGEMDRQMAVPGV